MSTLLKIRSFNSERNRRRTFRRGSAIGFRSSVACRLRHSVALAASGRPRTIGTSIKFPCRCLRVRRMTSGGNPIPPRHRQGDKQCGRWFSSRVVIGVTILLALVLVGGQVVAQRYLDGMIWKEPPVVTPGEGIGAALRRQRFSSTARTSTPGRVPRSGRWTPTAASPSRASFRQSRASAIASCTSNSPRPKEVKGNGQGRGNNGIGLMGARYEIQVLDSYDNPTYPEGQAASVYNQKPPMVNASRKPGRMADLRYHLHDPALRRGRQGDEAGLRDGDPQWRRRAESQRDPRQHAL